jgi:hypothetical protein
MHLRESHCKPWRDSSNEERINGENGLLLTPTVDHLFDRGFISFEVLIVSPVAHPPSLNLMGVCDGPHHQRRNVYTGSKAVSRLPPGIGSVASPPLDVPFAIVPARGGDRNSGIPRKSTHFLSLAKRPQTGEPNFPLVFRQDPLARKWNPSENARFVADREFAKATEL